MRICAPLLALALPLSAQDFSKIEIEKLAAGHAFTEGPVWSRSGYLLFSDIPANRIHKVSADGVQVFRDNSGGANGNTYDSKGRLYTCEGGARRVTRTGRDGKVEVLAERFEGKRLNSPNDIVVSADGHVYFTDPAFGGSADTRELDYYGVYHLTPKGELSVFAKPAGRPNGIALSPDGGTLYVSNSDERNIRAYTVGRDGVPAAERILVSGIEGVPDGLKTDEKGNLYVAARKLVIYSPHGALLHAIEMAETPSNCAWGGGTMQILFVTARTSVYTIRMPVKGSVQH